ncbi:FecR family protein [Pseudomonas flavescens]|uniref:FecR family protein n=1 Tax=Phytopseudomonas flavescens TaxID=29435 RepID=A0A1G8IBX4_9GAMM|nr:FecR family protein [Pseudomonas flavescens]SDI16352.1 FecR family protein [Pseudomonas flavescens]
MTLPPSTVLASEPLIDEAAHWCTRMHADDRTPEECADFDKWLHSDPRHAAEYRAMLEIWQVSEHLPRQYHRAAPPRRQRLGRPAMACAAVLCLAVAGLLGWQQGLLPDHVQRLQADTQVQQVTLADGSRVELNRGTTLWFANFRDQRSVTLKEGEAFFEVRHDAEHPFVVHAGAGSVTVTGTRFNVWKYQDQVVVTLSEGSVKVQSRSDRSDQTTYLTPGLQARYGADGKLPTLAAASASALAWRDGKLILDNLTLAEALPQINRYLDKPVVLADSAVAEMRIGGIYNTNDVAGLVRMLPKVLPIALSQNDAGDTVIRRR